MKDVASRSAAAGSSGPLRSFRESVANSAAAEARATEWVDGSEPETETYDDGDGAGSRHGERRLSKAEAQAAAKSEAGRLDGEAFSC